MRTVQITLDDDLATAVDAIAGQLHQSRSAFTRDALRAALGKFAEQARERQHRDGYLRQPVKPGEFSDFEDEQAWMILGPEDGMPETCAVNLDHLQTMAKARLGALITTVDEACLEQIRTAQSAGFQARLRSRLATGTTVRCNDQLGISDIQGGSKSLVKFNKFCRRQ